MRPAPSFLLLRRLAQACAHSSRPSFSRIPTPKRLFHPPRMSMMVRAHALRTQTRHESTKTPPPTSTTPPDSRLERDQVPAYELTFTCKVCTTRSSHRISKQGYHNGTILISCPGCKNRHLISDHLKIFSDKRVTLEDIMHEKGDLVKRGELGEGDIEFWEDGTTTERSAHFHPKSTSQNDPNAPQSTLTEPPSSEKP